MRIAHSIFSISIFVFCITACRKTTTKTIEEELPVGRVVVMGSFVSNDHPTSGTAKVIQEAGKQSLSLQNFKTDAGPDLRVWLATETNGRNYIELGRLKSTNGSFAYDIPANTDLTRYNKVLIWCIDFSVLFGHAFLQ